MHKRVGRGLLVLSAVLALLIAVPATTAAADTITSGNKVCSMYVNSVGFGAYCSSGTAYLGGGAPLPTWKQKLAGRPFIPCRDFPIPEGVDLPSAPDGKKWVMRVTIVDYEINSYNGGKDAHLERAYVPVGPGEENQCPAPEYMNQFWWQFKSTYPAPALQIMPTYTPRVNVPAFFTLTPETSRITKTTARPGTDPTDLNSGFYDQRHNLSMQGLVSEMTIDPGDGSPPFNCKMGVTPLDDPDGYDQSKGPDEQLNTCKHIYKRSSANQPDGMYTVKLTITWTVSYWVGKDAGGWNDLGKAEVHAVQRLPVQEVQAIGG
jgi:hypothetical protein